MNLPPKTDIKFMEALNDSVIIIGGKTEIGEQDHDFSTKSFCRLLFMEGELSNDIGNFDCDEISSLFVNDKTYSISGLKRTVNGSVEDVYFVLNSANMGWNKVNLPKLDVRTSPIILTNKIMLVNTTSNQFGSTFIKSVDGGLRWEKITFYMPIKEDCFEPKRYFRDKIIGLRTHTISSENANDYDFQSLVALNFDNWNIEFEIPLGQTTRDSSRYKINTYYLSDLIEYDGKIYLLGYNQITNQCFISSINDDFRGLSTIDQFKIPQNEFPSKLFLSKERLSVFTTNTGTFLPTYNLYFKNNGESNWSQVVFPSLSYSFCSISGDKVFGIQTGDRIIYRNIGR